MVSDALIVLSNATLRNCAGRTALIIYDFEAEEGRPEAREQEAQQNEV